MSLSQSQVVILARIAHGEESVNVLLGAEDDWFLASSAAARGSRRRCVLIVATPIAIVVRTTVCIAVVEVGTGSGM